MSKNCPGSQNYLNHNIRVSDKNRSEPNTGHLPSSRQVKRFITSTVVIVCVGLFGKNKQVLYILRILGFLILENPCCEPSWAEWDITELPSLPTKRGSVLLAFHLLFSRSSPAALFVRQETRVICLGKVIMQNVLAFSHKNQQIAAQYIVPSFSQIWC